MTERQFDRQLLRLVDFAISDGRNGHNPRGGLLHAIDAVAYAIGETLDAEDTAIFTEEYHYFYQQGQKEAAAIEWSTV